MALRAIAEEKYREEKAKNRKVLEDYHTLLASKNVASASLSAANAEIARQNNVIQGMKGCQCTSKSLFLGWYST